MKTLALFFITNILSYFFAKHYLTGCNEDAAMIGVLFFFTGTICGMLSIYISLRQID